MVPAFPSLRHFFDGAFVRVRRQRLAAACMIIPGASQAALEADITTSKGVVTVVLEHTGAPQAVANFMTLAQGSRNRVDSRSGAVSNDPAFNGLAFHDVVNDAGDKRAVCGSIDGSGTDRPGFTILDDLNSPLIRQPYVIAFASDGPNTGGSRFYLTGNVAMPERNGRDVVFGSVPSVASRQVIDQILAAGDGASTFQSVAFRRTDASAVAFDELAVPLPVVTALPSAPLLVTPGANVRLGLTRTLSTSLRASASPDLAGWEPVLESFLGADDPVPAGFPVIEPAAPVRRFYHFALTQSPGAGGAAGFAGRTLMVDSPGTGEIIYTFDATGLGGTFVNTPLPGFPLTFDGPFTVTPDIPAEFDAYCFSVGIHAPALGGSPTSWIRGGFDSVGEDEVTGRHITIFYQEDMTPAFEESGVLELSRP